MRRQDLIITISLCATILPAGAWLASAGDLNPPPGAVAPTQRTPVNANMTPGDADSLFKITQPGSYYLMGNIQGVAAKHGIEIAASGVTLDLNGFDLLGVAGSLDGVSVTVAGTRSIAVVNGSVRNWAPDGVDVSNASNARLADLRTSGNTQVGIRTGSNTVISGCTALSNSNAGILTGEDCAVTNCSAQSNGAGGGITALGGCTITGCSAQSNFLGIQALGTGTTITACTSNSNTAHGFNTSGSCSIIGCTANANGNNGITTSAGSTIIDCMVQVNVLDGINVSSETLVSRNTCDLNGNGGVNGAGIHATGFKNRIEGNNCTRAIRGIDVDIAGNIIIRNTCSANTTNWDIAANNVCGPIVDRTAPASAAILGNSAPDSTGSTHPNANFTY